MGRRHAPDVFLMCFLGSLIKKGLIGAGSPDGRSVDGVGYRPSLAIEETQIEALAMMSSAGFALFAAV